MQLRNSTEAVARIIPQDISGGDIDTIVRILNDEWGDFFVTTPAHIEHRLSSRSVLVGAYENESLVGILETQAVRLEGLDALKGDHQQKAYRVAQMLEAEFKDYRGLTHNGNWRPHPEYANVLTLVDITVDKNKRGNKAAPKMIEYGKTLLNGNRPARLEHINYVLTITPDIVGIKRWHEDYWAFDTKYRTEGKMRPGYREEHVNFMSYLAPGYVPQSGQRPKNVVSM